jgi:hypothetical protein
VDEQRVKEVIYCPRAKSDFTPCVARDGELAMADPDRTHPYGCCVGCDGNVANLFKRLVEKYTDLKKSTETPPQLPHP